MKERKNHCRFPLVALTLWAATLFTLFTTSCSNNDDRLSTIAETSQAEAALEARQQDDAAKTQALLEALCEIDPTTGAIGQPLFGRVLNSITPTITYAIANSIEEAEARYRGLLANIDQGLTAREIRQGDIHLTFTEGAEDGETGRIVVDCPRLSRTLTAIIFVTEARWPDNDLSAQINFMSVWRDKKTQRIYACVKPANPDTGILLYLNESGKDCSSSKASSKAIDALARIILDFPREYEEMFYYVRDVMIERGGGYRYFCTFQWLVMRHSERRYTDKEKGLKIVDILTSSGYAEFHHGQMPKHCSGSLPADKGIYAHSITFERETRLNDTWECLKH